MFSILQVTTKIYTIAHSGAEKAFWWDLSKDFLIPIAIAIIAAFTAYFIFIRETKRERANEERKKCEERNDKILFFSTLIDSCLSISVQQKNHLKEYIRKIKKNDIDFHLMTFVPLNDLHRVSKALNLELYLLAFVNKYSFDRSESIKKFKKIITSVDFLLEIYTQIPKQLEKAQMFDYDRKVKMQSLFKNAYNTVKKLIADFDGNNPFLVMQLLTLDDIFSKNYPGDKYKISYYYEYFFVPYNDFCNAYLANGNPYLQEIIDLELLTSDAIQLFSHIKSEHLVLKSDLTEDFKLIYSALLDLRTNAKQLLSEI